jgi:hypothetical protein
MLQNEVALVVAVILLIRLVIITIFVTVIIPVIVVIPANVGSPPSLIGARILGNFRVPSFVHDWVRRVSTAKS